MIISAGEMLKLIECDWTEERMKRKLLAIEQTIRSYTNNNFNNKKIRFPCTVSGGVLHGAPLVLKEGDTVQIAHSLYNDGLFVVASTSGGMVTVEEPLTDEPLQVLVTRVDYPADVVDCAINLITWDVNSRDKVGIKSETLSRHSTTYFDMDANNQVMGYPVSLLGVLRPYRKIRC